MAPSESLDAFTKRSKRDTLATAGKTGSTGGGGSREGLGVSMTIESGEGPAEGCAIRLDARRRPEDREPDKAAKISSSPADVPFPSDEDKLGSRRLCLPNFGVAAGFAGSRRLLRTRRPLGSRVPLGADEDLGSQTGDDLALDADDRATFLKGGKVDYGKGSRDRLRLDPEMFDIG